MHGKCKAMDKLAPSMARSMKLMHEAWTEHAKHCPQCREMVEAAAKAKAVEVICRK